MFRRIVCATDFSAPSATATRYAAAMARTFQAPLDLVHAWDFTRELPTEFTALSHEAISVSRQAHESKLESAARALHGVTATAHVVEGPSVRAIVDYAASSGADVLVTGTEGRTGVAHALLGSVAERILRTSDVPVLAVPKSTTVTDDARFAPKQILVPFDLSPPSAEIARIAAALASKAGGRLTALHVARPDVFSGADGSVSGPADADIPARASAWLRDVLGAGAASVSVVVEPGEPADVITRFAREHAIDLIVMATAGRVGIEHFMIGSVTERVLRKTGLPVLTFRRPPQLA